MIDIFIRKQDYSKQLSDENCAIIRNATKESFEEEMSRLDDKLKELRVFPDDKLTIEFNIDFEFKESREG